jgi:hypothetical protein
VHPRQTDSGVDNNSGHSIMCRSALDFYGDRSMPPLRLVPNVEEGPLSAVRKCLTHSQLPARPVGSSLCSHERTHVAQEAGNILATWAT